MNRERVFRLLTPVLLGATLVMMLRGDQLLALGLALAFFIVYVASGTPRPKQTPVDETDAEEDG